MTIFNSYVKLPEGSCVYVYQRLKPHRKHHQCSGPRSHGKIHQKRAWRSVSKVSAPRSLPARSMKLILPCSWGNFPWTGKCGGFGRFETTKHGKHCDFTKESTEKKNEKMAGSGRQARSGSNPQDFPIVSSQTKGRFLFVCASTKSGT